MEQPKKTFRQYLPSKKFIRALLVLIVAAALIAIIASIFTSRGNTNNLSRSTVAEVVGQDSNKNGVADWEESLWGLDPKGNGERNRALIDQKRAEAGLPPLSESSNEPASTKTETFTRDLLATILALHQSGQLTPEALVRLSESIGQDLDARREIEPRYSITDMNVVGDNEQVTKNYRRTLEELVATYEASDIGTEFEVIGEELETELENPSFGYLSSIADSYAGLAAEIVSIPTPPEPAYYALALANASAQISGSLQKIQDFESDTFSGMIGIDEYIDGQRKFDRAVDNLADYFAEN
jgi:hypothetical protein